MTSTPPLRAKSATVRGRPGELLTTHLGLTARAAQQIQARIGTIPGTPTDFWTWAALAALLHDTGKIPYGFQRMVGNTSDEAVPWGERHEILSLGFVEHLLSHLPDDDRLWIAAVVAGHHRPYTGVNAPRVLLAQLSDDTADDFHERFSRIDPEQLVRLLRWLRGTARRLDLPIRPDLPELSVRDLTDAAFDVFSRLMDRWERPLPPAVDAQLVGRTATLLLGAVTMADHLSSAHSPLDTHHPLTSGYPEALAERLAVGGHTLRPQQAEAAGTSGHLLLRSWTGSGKTEAVLLWARRQITELATLQTCVPRVFYVLPYLASINAMTERLEKELDARDRIGVAHSKAASYHLAQALKDGCPTDDGIGEPALSDDDAETADAAVKAHSRAQATRNFRELLRVGTPYQLLRGALAGPVHSGILTDSVNSVFVLDELHAYDARRLGMILAAMGFWHETGGRIAVMSATLPTRLAELVTETLDGQTTVVEPPPVTTAPARHRLHLRDNHLTSEAALAEIRTALDAGQSVLVVANNVHDAITLYETLAPYCVGLHGEGSAYLLHSRFRRMDRDTIETSLRQRFAAGRDQRLPGLLVGTQALEVSLDLDLDLCHTSAADLEALLQRFGRVNRLAARPPAPVIVHAPAYGPRRGAGTAEWADGVYEADPTRLAWDILARHDGQTIDEQQVTAWLDEIYASDWGDRWCAATLAARDEFHNAFLTFTQPFEDRTGLAEAFDRQFDGIEAVLQEDLAEYEKLLTTADTRSTGRLQADRYLIPLPQWAASAARLDKRLGVYILNADYDPELGLVSINHDMRRTYQAGEVL
ncbi:CRISPR-associated helicase Cas3' [Streptomyces sp. NPDC006684]|uniref:CRISPR-associated helicase Cas3' n=1 Tax=Streptomyces sp. NPDC006684 TaxID=3154477 RepID=UPI003456D93B